MTKKGNYMAFLKLVRADQRGFAAVIAVIMVAMLTLLGLAALSTSDDELTLALNQLAEVNAFYAAEAGLQKAAAHLQTEYDSTGAPPVIMPSETVQLNNCNVSFVTQSDGTVQHRILTNGTLAGLHALVKSFTMTSTAVNPAEAVGMELQQSFEAALVPIFQFAVFYENDLEIAPGPDMILVGRVHTNGDLYIQAGSSLKMESFVTAAGGILHGSKGSMATTAGDVLIKDTHGNYISMKDGAGWLDADDPYWYDSSVFRWQGRVQDAAHGQTSLALPLTAGDPHQIIERGTATPDSYEHKSSLKILDRTAFRLVGSVWTDVTADMVAKGILTFSDNQFHDGRESVGVDVTELDVAKLYSEGYGPSNGVIYFSDQDASRDFPAVRLNNGPELGSGLSVVSENPVYVRGDFNSVNKKPASVMGDAVTFLSNTWSDALSSGAVSGRVAANTTVNVSYITGNVETTSTDYSGGFENLPRFLEDWTGKNFTWSGSAVNLWSSQQATGLWGGSYYVPPNRVWSFDTDLDDPNKLPPETPCIRVFQRTGWKQEYVGYEE